MLTILFEKSFERPEAFEIMKRLPKRELIDKSNYYWQKKIELNKLIDDLEVRAAEYDHITHNIDISIHGKDE